MWPKITQNYSPNFSTPKRLKKNINYIIIHYTGMKNELMALNRLTNYKSKVSAHYFIKKNGKIHNLVPDLYEAWHAGKSNWKRDFSLNRKSIGIEISNRGHQFGYESYSKSQIKSLIKLSKYLKAKYKIKRSNFLGHSDIAYNRKKDPGEKFPWKNLSEHKIGFWHNLNESFLKKKRSVRISKANEDKFFNCLFKQGFILKSKNPKNKFLLVKSFQRHFRQKMINGIVDLECLIIAEKLSKLSK